MNFEVRVNGQTLGSLERSEIERRAPAWQRANAAVEIVVPQTKTSMPLADFLAWTPKAAAKPQAPPPGMLDQFDIPSGHYQVDVNGQRLGVLSAPEVIRRSRHWGKSPVQIYSPLIGVLGLQDWLDRMAARFDPMLWPRSADTEEYTLRHGGQTAMQDVTRAEIEWRAAQNLVGAGWEVGSAGGGAISVEDFLEGRPIPRGPVNAPPPRAGQAAQSQAPRGASPSAGAAAGVKAAAFAPLVFGPGPYFVRIANATLGPLQRDEIERRSKSWPANAAEVGENAAGPFVPLAEFLRMPLAQPAARPPKPRTRGLLLGAGAICVLCLALIAVKVLPRMTDHSADVQKAEDAMKAGDFDAASQLLQKNNSPEAKFELACLYKNGLGVQQDTQKASELLRASADAGLPLAQTMLGLWYANGDGVEANTTTAASWYRKAATQGDSNASVLLALAYAGGDGVEQDAGKAFLWFTVAEKQGNSYATSQKDLIGDPLEAAQKEAAERGAEAEFAKQSGGKHE